MKYLLAALLLLLTQPVLGVQNHLLIVSGIGGEDQYRQLFSQLSNSLYQSAIALGIDQRNIILLSEQPAEANTEGLSDKAGIGQALRKIGAQAAPDDRVFIVLIGHGNARANSAVFNLPGPDISAEELAAALRLLPQQLIVVNTASASGAFIDALSQPNRVVITATSSAREYHAPLFATHFIAAFAQPGADRNKDERISMLEAFDYARREVLRAYESDKRLLTEHALLDDSGDGVGSLDPGEDQSDGQLAHLVFLQPPVTSGASAALTALVQRKQVIEQDIADLKRLRNSLARADYYQQLERLLIDLALLSREIRAQES